MTWNMQGEPTALVEPLILELGNSLKCFKFTEMFAKTYFAKVMKNKTNASWDLMVGGEVDVSIDKWVNHQIMLRHAICQNVECYKQMRW